MAINLLMLIAFGAIVIGFIAILTVAIAMHYKNKDE